MRRWIALLFAALLALSHLPSWAQVPAQARVFNQAELDALLAPVALYPDPVLSNILMAATYPDDLRDAAAWSRANPQLTGENAVSAAEPIPWHPSVKALLAFPELLARMNESPQWTADLGAAFLEQEPYVMDTVQGLRRRAQASGSLQSNDQYSVQQEGSSIAVYPAQPQVVYVPYYDPYVVYGPWWWPAYRPVYWQPWFTHPTVFFTTTTFVHRSVDWHRRHVVRRFPHHPAPIRHGAPPAVQQVHAPQHWRNQQQWREQHPHSREQHQQWREQQQRWRAQQPQGTPPGQAAPQNRPAPAPQGRPALAQDQHSGQDQPRWREQQQRGREQPRPETRVPRMNPPNPPVPSTNPPRTQAQMPQLRSMVETIRNPPQPVARQLVETIRNHAAPAVHAVTQTPQARQAQPHFQHRGGGERQPGRQANHHSQRRN